jgi:hypothetical protein
MHAMQQYRQFLLTMFRLFDTPGESLAGKVADVALDDE